MNRIMLDKIKNRLKSYKQIIKDSDLDFEEHHYIQGCVAELEYLLDWWKRKGKQRAKKKVR